MNTVEKVQAVINTLNKVTVSGYNNMSHLLGCIQTLDQVKKELEAKPDADVPSQN